jgi:holo-[acyl-carrier protein] synthase
VIVGLGIDVVEIARIARILDGPATRADRFLERCFTRGERAYCEGVRDRAARYAARFAAKEAASKALGTPPGIAWHDVEVVRAASAPSLALGGVAAATARRLGGAATHVSLTHDGGVAAAVVVLDGAAR